MPAIVAKHYYARATLHEIGVFVQSGMVLSDGHLLSRPGIAYVCGHANIHLAHVQNVLSAWRESRNVRHVSGVCALVAGPGLRIFGHWLVDLLPKIAILDIAGFDLTTIRFPFPADTPAFGLRWLQLLGIQPEQIVLYDTDHELLELDTLLIPTTLHNGVRTSPVLADVVAFMRRAISLPPVNNQPQRMFISRSKTSQSRPLVNRSQIEAMAVKAGFSLVYPERMSLQEQVALFAGARQIVGEYGSALHSSMFAAPGTVVCAIRGSEIHPGFIQSGIGAVLRQPTGYVIGGTDVDDPHGAFSVPEDVFADCLRHALGNISLDGPTPLDTAP